MSYHITARNQITDQPCKTINTFNNLEKGDGMGPDEMLKQFDKCRKAGNKNAMGNLSRPAETPSFSGGGAPQECTRRNIDSERALKARLNEEEKSFIEYLANALPPIIGRAEVDRFLPGLIKPQTLAQADSAGLGPEIAWKLGRKVAYRTDSLLLWLVGRYGGVVRLIDMKKYLSV